MNQQHIPLVAKENNFLTLLGGDMLIPSRIVVIVATSCSWMQFQVQGIIIWTGKMLSNQAAKYAYLDD